MSTQIVSNHRENAEIYTGEDLCKQKSVELLTEFSFPNGLLPLEELIEVGYNRATGFVWLKQAKRKDHRFRAIGRTVSYETEVTGFIENRRLRKLTGVKSKEILIWVTISDIYIQDSDPSRITFGTPAGLSRSFPVSAFVVEDQK